jgi:hypothetical protein
MSSVGLALAVTVPCVFGCCYLSVDACVFPREFFGLWCFVLLSMLVFSRVVAVSTFGHLTERRYNNTHCTYGVNLQHEGSIFELHCAKSFFSRARGPYNFFCITQGSNDIFWSAVQTKQTAIQRMRVVCIRYTCMLCTREARTRKSH